jgi:hypothetical protein
MDFLFLVLWPFTDGGKGPEPETAIPSDSRTEAHFLGFLF